MALTTLATVKGALGISDTSQDTQIQFQIASASALIRNHCNRWLGALIQNVATGNPAVITCPGHGLEDQETVVIYNSGSTPSIDGPQTITFIDESTFSVPVNVTVASTPTACTISRTVTEYYNGTNTPKFWLKGYPVQGIASLYLDSTAYYGQDSISAFGPLTQLIEGTDFVLERDQATSRAEVSRSGLVRRIMTIWPKPPEKTRGLLGLTVADAIGNIKVTYTFGWKFMPQEIKYAATAAVIGLRRILPAGGVMQQENYDFYSYVMADPSLALKVLGDVKGSLKRHKEVVI